MPRVRRVEAVVAVGPRVEDDEGRSEDERDVEPEQTRLVRMGLHVVDRLCRRRSRRRTPTWDSGAQVLAEASARVQFGTRVRVADEARRELDVDDFRVVASTALEQRRRGFPFLITRLSNLAWTSKSGCPPAWVSMDGAERVDPLVGLRISSG